MITLFVDASHCSQTLAAGWGAWAIGDGWDHGRTFGGQISRRVTNSGEAEMAAVEHAVREMGGRGWLGGDDALMLQSDSHRALQLFLVQFPNAEIRNHANSAPFARTNLLPSKAEEIALMNLEQHLTRFKWLFVRHVKGHSEGEGRNWVNRKCDEIAKQNMRRMRKSKGGYRH